MMNPPKHIQNASLSIIATALQGLVNLVTVVYLARVLGPRDYGVFSYTWAVVIIVGVLAYLGIPSLIAREVSRGNAKYWTTLGVSLSGSLGLVVSIGFFLVVQLLPHMGKNQTLFDLWAVFIFVTAVSPRMWFGAIQRLWIASLGDFAGALLRLILTVAFVHGSQQLRIAIGITVLSFLLPVLGELIWLRRIIPYKVYLIPGREALATIQRSLPLGIAGFVGIMYSGLDTWILQLFVGSRAVGLYSAAYRPIGLLLTFSGLSFNFMFPILSKHVLRSTAFTERALQLGTEALAAVVLPIGVGTVVIAAPLVHQAFGRSYVPSGPVLAIIIWSWCLGLLRELFSTTLIAANQEKTFSRLFTVSGVANVILMLILVRWGPQGTAAALVLTQALLLALCYLAVRRLIIPTPIHWPTQGRSLVKIALNSAFMGVVVWFVRPYVAVEISIAIGIAVYAILTFATRSVPWHEILTAMRATP